MKKVSLDLTLTSIPQQALMVLAYDLKPAGLVVSQDGGLCIHSYSSDSPEALQDGDLLVTVRNAGEAVLSAYRQGVREIAEEFKELCNDFSSRNGNVYIKDVAAMIDAMVERLTEVPDEDRPQA